MISKALPWPFPLLPAREADVPALAALAARTLPTPWSAGSLAAALADPHACLLVARTAAAPAMPAGFLLARHVVDELHVLLLTVEPSWQRRGAASALIARALARGRAAGARSAQLEVRAGNEPARALYAGFGFREVGRRRRYYADGEDAVLLTLELGAGSPAGGVP